MLKDQSNKYIWITKLLTLIIYKIKYKYYSFLLFYFAVDFILLEQEK